ncbi:MAG: cohesin domain-containing protein [Candidatus Binatia bacterium]
MAVIRSLTRPVRSTLLAGAGGVVLIAASWTVFAGPLPQDPVLSLNGGTGIPGGTVAVTLSLQGDPENQATSADADISYPDDVLDISNPIAEVCQIDPRIADTHLVAGQVVEPGVLRVAVAVSGSPVELPALGDGDLVTCEFGILPGVPTGTAAVEFQFHQLFAGLDPIDSGAQNGSVSIVESFPTPTPTLTETPEVTATATTSATATVTETPEVTATATNTFTPTNPPTATNTVPPTATATGTRTSTPPSTSTATVTRTPRSDDDSGCNVVATHKAFDMQTAALVLMPALLLWLRRRP